MDNLKLICFFLLIFPLGGCDIFDCGEDIVPVSYFSSVSCEFNNYGIEDREALYLINNEGEFNEHIGCEYLDIDIDYEQNSLLIGRFASYSCGELVSQSLRSRCSRTDVEIEIQPMDCAAINIITFGAIIPKGFENERFRLRVKEL